MTGSQEQNVRNLIIQSISETPSGIEQLIKNIRDYEENDIISVVQNLLDLETIYYDERGRLHYTAVEDSSNNT